MGTRTRSHQLSSGLYVSGLPEQLKDRTPTMASRAVIYTGGDVKKSGELGKMFDITQAQAQSQPITPKPTRPTSSSSRPNSGSIKSGSNSAPLTRVSTSGSILHPTGLITSGPLGSSGGGGGRTSGHLDGSGQGQPVGKPVYGSALTSLGSERVRYGVRVSREVIWVFGILGLMGLLVGVFVMVVLKKAVILVAFGVVLVAVVVGVCWNYGWRKRAILGFVRKFRDTELRGAVDGQFVKVTGVVTCGSIPLESSFQSVPRCVYVSTELYEYKGWSRISANPRHRFFSWGCRHSEKYVADFYMSDFHTGLRALVKTGYGAKVAPFVEPATVVDMTKEKRDLSPNFLRWLADRSLSSDDRIMRLKEGYVKEGSAVSVMGVVRRQENILTIVPSAEPISTGCQWLSCLLPMYVEGLILHCDDNQNSEVIPV